MNKSDMNLRIKTGQNSYFIADGERLAKLNSLLCKEGLESVFFQEEDSVFWIKTDLLEGSDVFWVEATPEEIEAFLALGDKSFFKKVEINSK